VSKSKDTKAIGALGSMVLRKLLTVLASLPDDVSLAGNFVF
jgi:hypothetical protein